MSGQALMMRGFPFYSQGGVYSQFFPHLHGHSRASLRICMQCLPVLQFLSNPSCFAQCALRPLWWKNLGRTKAKQNHGPMGKRNLITPCQGRWVSWLPWAISNVAKQGSTWDVAILQPRFVPLAQNLGEHSVPNWRKKPISQLGMGPKCQGTTIVMYISVLLSHPFSFDMYTR